MTSGADGHGAGVFFCFPYNMPILIRINYLHFMNLPSLRKRRRVLFTAVLSHAQHIIPHVSIHVDRFHIDVEYASVELRYSVLER